MATPSQSAVSSTASATETASPTPSAEPTTPLSFDEECDGTTMSDLWQFDGAWGAGFGSDAQFMPDPATVVVSYGICHVIAERRRTTSGRAYAATILSTRGRWSQAFGTWEARIRLPAGYALWPAFWLDPADGSWPPEIDIVESLPVDSLGPHAPAASAVLHYDRLDLQRAVPMPPGVDLTEFHVYKMVWTPAALTFFFDGVPVGEITQNVPTTPMFPILDLTVGDPGHRADGRTPASASLDVDYIRVSP